MIRLCPGVAAATVPSHPPPPVRRNSASSLPRCRCNRSPGRIGSMAGVSSLPCRWNMRLLGHIILAAAAWQEVVASLSFYRCIRLPFTQSILDRGRVHRGTAAQAAQALTSVCFGVTDVSLLTSCHNCLGVSQLLLCVRNRYVGYSVSGNDGLDLIHNVLCFLQH